MAAINGLIVSSPTGSPACVTVGAGSSYTVNANGSVSFSSCESLSLNNVFSSTYDNYMISIAATATAAQNWHVRFRSGGVDNATASSYITQTTDANSTSLATQRTTADYGRWFYGGSVRRTAATMYLFGPYLVQGTTYRSVSASDLANSYMFDCSVNHSVSASYDGFTIFRASASGAITGKITVYGFNQ